MSRTRSFEFSKEYTYKWFKRTEKDNSIFIVHGEFKARDGTSSYYNCKMYNGVSCSLTRSQIEDSLPLKSMLIDNIRIFIKT